MSFDIFPLVKRLYDRLTQQRADDMDNLANIDAATMANLDATVSSRAIEVNTAKSNVCTEERLAKLDLAPPGIGLRNVQRGQVTIAQSVELYQDVTISAVVLNKSFEYATWHAVNFFRDAGIDISVQLISPTVLRIQKTEDPGDVTNEVRVNWVVVEFF